MVIKKMIIHQLRVSNMLQHADDITNNYTHVKIAARHVKSDIHFIQGDIHGWWCQKFSYIIFFPNTEMVQVVETVLHRRHKLCYPT